MREYETGLVLLYALLAAEVGLNWTLRGGDENRESSDREGANVEEGGERASLICCLRLRTSSSRCVKFMLFVSMFDSDERKRRLQTTSLSVKKTGEERNKIVDTRTNFVRKKNQEMRSMRRFLSSSVARCSRTFSSLPVNRNKEFAQVVAFCRSNSHIWRTAA